VVLIRGDLEIREPCSPSRVKVQIFARGVKPDRMFCCRRGVAVCAAIQESLGAIIEKVFDPDPD
jgi:hypothetical protein